MAIPLNVVTVIEQINQLLGLAATGVAAARALRDAARAAAPSEQLPSDAALIQKLLEDARLGKQEAREFREWLATLEAPPSSPVIVRFL